MPEPATGTSNDNPVTDVNITLTKRRIYCQALDRTLELLLYEIKELL